MICAHSLTPTSLSFTATGTVLTAGVRLGRGLRAQATGVSLHTASTSTVGASYRSGAFSASLLLDTVATNFLSASTAGLRARITESPTVQVTTTAALAAVLKAVPDSEFSRAGGVNLTTGTCGVVATLRLDPTTSCVPLRLNGSGQLGAALALAPASGITYQTGGYGLHVSKRKCNRLSLGTDGLSAIVCGTSMDAGGSANKGVTAVQVVTAVATKTLTTVTASITNTSECCPAQATIYLRVPACLFDLTSGAVFTAGYAWTVTPSFASPFSGGQGTYAGQSAVGVRAEGTVSGANETIIVNNIPPGGKVQVTMTPTVTFSTPVAGSSVTVGSYVADIVSVTP